jgi:shikimate kinase
VSPSSSTEAAWQEDDDTRLKRRPLVLTGYMGAGKSTIGKMLAARLGFEFHDTDRVIVKRQEKSISRIFKEQGEPFFRTLEREVLSELLRLSRIVLSTGGGTLAEPDNLQLALATGTVIYLEAPPEVLFERVIFSRKDRPMIDVPNAEQVFQERFRAREGCYRQAHITVQTVDKAPMTVVEEIIQRLGLEIRPI